MMSSRSLLPCVLVIVACSSRPIGLDRWNTAPTPETHELYFPIAQGAHAGIDCNVCHGAFDTFTRFDCLNGCHAQAETDPKHAGIGDYRYESAFCYECHPDGGAGSAVDHSKIFPISVGSKHEGVRCTSCHEDRANRKNVTCGSALCHVQAETSAAHAGVGGYAWMSSLCKRCHGDSQVDRVAMHLPFAVASGPHRGERCLTCHPQSRTDKPFAADFVPFDCFAGCHSRTEMDSKHRGFAEYKPEPTTCVLAGCHQNGRKP